MRIEWGSAELRREDRYLIWHRHEPLPIAGLSGAVSGRAQAPDG
ncbi:hypothetical protein ACS0VI_10755 [Streptomyces sp. H28]|nr:hypothetical protein [Streptomyces sp. H28]